YEDLIRNPDKVQKEISAKFGLKIKDLFSEYPEFLPKGYANTKEANYSIRKISNNSIRQKKQLNFYKNKFFKNKKDLFLKFKNELIFANYL
ncbi:hypothetical protein CMI41_04745, partial [Candidatus Pacearchaeota archaeon]|nr:hypothetical protein [Candidatus Pacearchaeota archaeon]